MRTTIGLIAGLMLAPVTAKAGEVWSISGRCLELRASGHDFTSGCSTKVINANNDQGQVAFIFTVKTGALISFAGNGSQQVESNKTATQPVNEVVFSVGVSGVPDNRFRAAGTCKFGDAFAGVTQITCTASTKEGEFSARFMTDGKAPSPGY